MNLELILRRMRRWPRWTIIPVGLALATFAILLGLLLEPAGYALSPNLIEPTATMPTIAYSGAHAGGCHDCHFSLSALQASAADSSTAQAYLIEAESIATPHGKLGCIACHGGDGEATGKDIGHQGLMADMSAQQPKQCLICHESIPGEIPGDRLRVPHGLIIERIEQDTPCDVHCSDCHGGVGHGFDPLSGAKFCSMTVCLDCHQERNLDVQMADCDACHLGPHDVVASFTCSDCHASTEIWKQVEFGIHPGDLPGKHGETFCFECHRYPDFEGLNNVCADCHLSGHTDWVDQDCAGCHDPGATWAMVASTWDGHVEVWDQYKGAHVETVTCLGCHFETYAGIDPNCKACHAVPSNHDDGRSAADCVECHQADQQWDEMVAPEG